MNQFIVETHIEKGHLELNNIPFPDDIDVKVIVIPKMNLSKASFPAIRDLTESIKGNLSDDINSDRDER